MSLGMSKEATPSSWRLFKAWDTLVELCWATLLELFIVDVFVDVEFPHQGKQPEPLHMKEWFGPNDFLLCAPGKCLGSKSVVNVRNSGEVPGVTGQGACEKPVLVVDEVGDDHFDDIHGKSDDRGRACCGGLQISTP